MINILIKTLIYLGSILMVYNIYGFVCFVKHIKKLNSQNREINFLNLPIFLLVGFLIGYLIVGFLGKPDLVVAGILSGGSVFVFLIYRYLWNITEWIVENNDLTTRLQIEKESSQAKSDFLGSVSHEMRTPMNVVLGISSQLLREGDLKKEDRDKVEKIDYAAHHMLGLIDNILEINELEGSELVLKEDEFALDDICKQLSVSFESQCAAKGLEYEFELQKEACRSYLGDEAKIKQVLSVFLDNGLKYTDVPGKLEFRIRKLQSTGDQDVISFVVKDTGIGIYEDFIPKLFQKFSQEDTGSTSKRGGGGLSLSIAKGLVDLMNGTINVESKKDMGSTFEIVLPLTKVEKEEEIELGEECLKDYRILVVEDIDDNAEIVSDLLELEGALPERAVDGKQALDKFAQSEINYYDAILMDLRMPVMDGLQSTREIRKLDRADSRTVPIIALTANMLEEDIEHTAQAGMNAHLGKPIDADKLYRTLKTEIVKGEKHD